MFDIINLCLRLCFSFCESLLSDLYLQVIVFMRSPKFCNTINHKRPLSTSLNLVTSEIRRFQNNRKSKTSYYSITTRSFNCFQIMILKYSFRGYFSPVYSTPFLSRPHFLCFILSTNNTPDNW